MIHANTIQFLKELKKNNNKPWFDLHRKEYEAAKENFTAFVQKVIDEFSKVDDAFKTVVAKDCLFRINRDVRFSKDKSPYKTNFGASINAGGKKSPGAGYYFHLEPGEVFTGGGVWQPMPDVLKKVRQEIDYNLPEFKKVISNKAFKTVYGNLSFNDEFTLSRVPKGFEPDNPAAEYLKLTSYIAMLRIEDGELTGSELVKKTVQAFKALKPVVDFINVAMHEG